MGNDELLRQYNEQGFVVIRNAVDSDIIDKYIELWNEENQDRPEGWSVIGGSGTAFLHYPEILDVLCAKRISETFDAIKKSVALHADVTYSVSTELDWHQDNTMPVVEASDNYVGCWVALEDVDEQNGPLEYVPGSHLWDLDYDRIFDVQDKGFDNPEFNRGRLDLYREEISKRKAEIVKFTCAKGDAFIWHGRLLHRGSKPSDRTRTRMSLIGHYCNNYAHLNPGEVPEFEEIKQSMFEQSERYAAWKNGAFYFSNP